LPSSSVSSISGPNSGPAVGSVPGEHALPQEAKVDGFVAVHDYPRVVVGRRLHTPEDVLEHIEGVFGSIHKGHADFLLLP